MVAAAISCHAVDDETARWVAKLGDKLSDKFARVGLIRPQSSSRLAEFIDEYIQSRHDLKPRTIVLCKQARNVLTEYFGEEKLLRDITPGDADDWRLFLLGKGLGENTVRRLCGRGKQFFNVAVRKNLVPRNPFSDLSGAVRANPSKFYFITREEAVKVLDACPDPEWRLLFALSRYGGLRCPSEHLSLTWGDIDWAQARMCVRSPKTEHHEGCESRIVPLFPELRPYLEEVFEQAKEGTKFVITRCRSQNTNLRTQLLRIIKRAGLNPWPKLFQNLRSTRETELAEDYPMHVVCAWIGNSQPIAQKHYLQITDAHFAKSGAESGAAHSRREAQEPEQRSEPTSRTP